MILALLQPLMLLLLGRHAPEKMKPKKKISPRKLLTIWDLWIVLVPCVCVNLVVALLEPAWQPFLGVDPFNYTPAQVSNCLATDSGAHVATRNRHAAAA